MILVLGGTSETAETALALAEAGLRVLVSTATDVPLAVGDHPGVTRRSGRLTQSEMLALIRARGARAIVDVTHPYATQVKESARAAAQAAGIPYFAYLRPGLGAFGPEAQLAADHEQAARLAFSLDRPVLLTTGSRNLEPYVRASRRTGLPLIVRVLGHQESLETCRQLGLAPESIVVGRGPFSVEDTRALLRQHCIGVLVTKDSGAAGGVAAKLEAARLEACSVIVVQRPESPDRNTFDTIASLVAAVRAAVAPCF